MLSQWFELGNKTLEVTEAMHRGLISTSTRAPCSVVKVYRGESDGEQIGLSSLLQDCHFTHIWAICNSDPFAQPERLYLSGSENEPGWLILSARSQAEFAVLCINYNILAMSTVLQAMVHRSELFCVPSGFQ